MDLLNYPCPKSDHCLAHFCFKIRPRQKSNQLTITTCSLKCVCRLFIRLFILFVSPVHWEFTWYAYLPVSLDVILKALMQSYIIYKYSSGLLLPRCRCRKSELNGWNRGFQNHKRNQTWSEPWAYSSRYIGWWQHEVQWPQQTIGYRLTNAIKCRQWTCPIAATALVTFGKETSLLAWNDKNQTIQQRLPQRPVARSVPSIT